jgi:hypothetical protein
MSTTDQFLLGLQAYQEIQAELSQEEKNQSGISVTEKVSLPHPHISTPPSGSLLLGVAEDKLPILFDLYDPTPGPLLIAGDRGSGKTAVLKWLARASDLWDPGDIEFGVVTPFPEEWAGLEDLPNGMGIWPAYHPSAHQFLSKLVHWAEVLPKTRQVIVLLVDGLDLLAGNGFNLQQELRWLLANGPARRVWPVVTTNPAHLPHMLNWLDYFHTRILGKMKYEQNARLFVDDPKVNLSGLIPGIEFGLYQPGHWLKFLLPQI